MTIHSRRRAGRERLALLFAALVAGCAAGGAARSSSIASAATSSDGPLVVAAPDQVLNRYAALTADAAAGASTLVVDSASALGLAPGDLVLVMQMQGAVIDSANAASYGRVRNRAGAGDYEIVQVGSVSGSSIALDEGCDGLLHSYRASAATQVIRVPRYTRLGITAAGSVTAPPWDGRVGGVIAVIADDLLTLDGSIDASARGFRGGIRDNVSANSSAADQEYRSTNGADGGEKGESIAGFGTAYDLQFGGRYSRGAAANGGGGGTSHNGGGGGGANGDSGDGWSGDGVMDPATIGAAAWTLDPAYARNGGRLSRSSGGGRGGYTFSFSNQDALTVPPGDPAWSGNLRRERGGHGGRPLANDAAGPLFLGGGGGAGGGLVLLISDQVRGAGAIVANGGDGENTRNGGNDGPGGGGAGGTVVVAANLSSGFTIAANGGHGGSQSITTLETEGPGAGGGGGYIAVGGGVIATAANGGVNGTTDSMSLTEFPANGATLGAAGQPNEIADPLSLPVCRSAATSVLPPRYEVAGSGGCNAGESEAAPLAVEAAALGLVLLAWRRRARA